MDEVSGRSPLGKEWRFLADHPGYMVSSHGDVRRVQRGAAFLIGDKDPKGYRRVLIGGRHRRVARLVAEAFHGPCPPEHECAHLDGNKENNCANNLSWVTRAENTRHSIAHGTYSFARNCGEKHHQAKLTSRDILAIRRKADAGMSRRALSQEFGVSATQIHRIITKEKWANV